jgi:hypothetical protein
MVSRAVGQILRTLSWRWSRDGRYLYYVDGQGVFEVAFEGTDAPVIGEPELLIAHSAKYADIEQIAGIFNDRFLTLRYTSKPTVEPMRLILNWQRLLED